MKWCKILKNCLTSIGHTKPHYGVHSLIWLKLSYMKSNGNFTYSSFKCLTSAIILKKAQSILSVSFIRRFLKNPILQLEETKSIYFLLQVKTNKYLSALVWTSNQVHIVSSYQEKFREKLKLHARIGYFILRN